MLRMFVTSLKEFPSMWMQFIVPVISLLLRMKRKTFEIREIYAAKLLEINIFFSAFVYYAISHCAVSEFQWLCLETVLIGSEGNVPNEWDINIFWYFTVDEIKSLHCHVWSGIVLLKLVLSTKPSFWVNKPLLNRSHSFSLSESPNKSHRRAELYKEMLIGLISKFVINEDVFCVSSKLTMKQCSIV